MDYIKVNRDTWNKRTDLHTQSSFYNIPMFKNGRNSLNPIELALLPDVKDKSLLHLQCHFGQDTLSWARLGACVTGVDLSPTAIEYANELKQNLNLEATFIESNVYDFDAINQQLFDIVYTSYGVLNWLPDLNRWAKVIANSLQAGGTLCLVEFHSFNELLNGYSYFHDSEPTIEEEGTYNENCDGTKSKTVTWSHSISDIINSLIQAGLTIESFDEYPYSPYDCFEGLEYVHDKGYQLLHKGHQVPLVFSIKARKGC